MFMRIIGLLFATGVLLGCGSGQPGGELTSCSGLLTVKEDLPDIAWSQVQSLGPGSMFGQYVRFTSSMVVKEIMLRTISVNASGFTVSIYKNRVTDTIPLSEQPIKVFTVTKGLTVDENFEMWLQLPEPFEFEATSAADVKDGLFYFIALEPLDSGLSVWLSNRDSGSRLREGLRWGTNSDPPFHPTDTSKAFGMGFRGESKCQITKN